MRLRVMEGRAEMAVLDVASAEELARVLACIHDEGGVRLRRAVPLQVHLWHEHAWWNLSDDLSQFFAWIIETGTGSLDETRAFAAAPLSKPEWLFEAAQQMKNLLSVTMKVHPNEKLTSEKKASSLEGNPSGGHVVMPNKILL